MYKVAQDAKSSQLTVYEFNDKFRLVDEGQEDNEGKVTIEIPGLAMISDMAATSNYAVFVTPAVTAGMQFLFNKEPGKVVNVEKAPATLHLVPRVGSPDKEAVSVEIPFDGVIEAGLQFVNAYEDGNKVIFDATRSDGTKKSSRSSSSSAASWPWVTSRDDYAGMASKTSLWRYEVDLTTKKVTKKLLTDTQCFFGSVKASQSTLKHDSIFMAIGGLGDDTAPPQGIARFDFATKSMDAWMPASSEFCGEPMFAPKVGSDNDGYILTVLFNGQKEESELLVFESSSISAGPVCRIPLGFGIPHGLHGCFTDAEEATWSFEEIQRRAKLADKMESRGNLWNEVKSDFSGLGLRFDDMEEYFGDSFLS
jgi:all-trans-8'-apo-beta-carotenal 15,15'-oxygenase